MQTAGWVGVALLWISGIWGAVAAWETYKEGGLWRRAAQISWLLHTLSLIGILGLLLFILLGHRYEFHYAWAHGSRQLPVEYITAALWEGQEGSFLLWMIWHVVFGWGILLSRDKNRWGLLAGLLAVNGYLGTFLLGASLPSWSVAMAAGLLWSLWAAEGLSIRSRLSGAVLLAAVVLWNSLWGRLLLIAAILILSIYRQFPLRAAVGAWAIALLPVGKTWGSFPFLYLWEVRSDVAEGFIPSDGNGLNPLLQSFWMVIHPPVLFSGYAAAVLPFLEGFLALRAGGLTAEYSRRLLRWLWLAITLLGLGIALGAYWAYETLNFGGYWNWDPVENASLAPWLVLVAGAHLVWVWRRQRKGETTTLILTSLAFPLVLYSSYLTRSGVLAESSVHSFTDLGLGEWLLWGVGVSMGGIALAAIAKVRFQILSEEIGSLLRSSLAVGVVLLTWVAFLLLILTSLPVLNKLLGTSWTLGSRALQVYYEWVGIFTVPVLGLMGYSLMQAFRARGWMLVVWLAAILLAGIVFALWWMEWDLVYHPSYRKLLESSNWLLRLRGGIFLLLDDLLWVSALIALGAAIAVLLQRRKGSHLWAVTAHSGFAIMIIGALLSSGYEKVLSQNFNPRSPSGGDNIFLPHGGSAVAIGYFVRYEGLVEPLPPIRDVRPVLTEGNQTLWRFRDSLGFPYHVWLANEAFSQKGLIHPVALPAVHSFIESNLALLPVEPADRRFRYRVHLTTMDSTRTYQLLLEADISEASGMIAHPAHVRLWHGDLYVHLTSLPQVEGPPVEQGIIGLSIGDTIQWDEFFIRFERLTEVENAPHPTFRAWLSIWRGLPQSAQKLPVEFAIRDKEMITPTASLPGLGLTVQLDHISVRESKLYFRVALRRRPDSFITLKILYKPFIGLFWGGMLLTLVGTLGAIFRHKR
ncbi:MAG: cytochrome c biogenesis protein CcsA [Bacteroidia bacterium]|nr:cytochrome c biogenesis protein CcsA [Bacteroidia bacterium]MCX7763969.1 cytochrome c biogenesis protein CcsA [Bacteroidia bacterium]MDW8057970.1 cytochrome c biogenesis protein CcsA [Bacteroidia bacterium]